MIARFSRRDLCLAYLLVPSRSFPLEGASPLSSPPPPHLTTQGTTTAARPPPVLSATGAPVPADQPWICIDAMISGFPSSAEHMLLCGLTGQQALAGPSLPGRKTVLPQLLLGLVAGPGTRTIKEEEVVPRDFIPRPHLAIGAGLCSSSSRVPRARAQTGAASQTLLRGVCAGLKSSAFKPLHRRQIQGRAKLGLARVLGRARRRRGA